MGDLAAQAFWIGFAVSAALAWPCLIALRRLRAESVISRYAPASHQSKAGTPSMGGLFVIAAVAATLAWFAATEKLRTQAIAALSIVFVGFALVGFLDDFVMPRVAGKRGLGWIPKLSFQFGIVSAFAIVEGFSELTVIAAVIMVASANAVNFADGLDALAGSLLVFAALPFGVYFVSASNPFSTAIALTIVGSLLPFLVLNAPPAKLFMGDVGSLALGALFGYLFANSPWRTELWPWIASLILILELLLVPLQLAAVKVAGRRIFPATPIHHSFEVIGWPESRVVWLFLVAQLTLSAAAVTEILS